MSDLKTIKISVCVHNAGVFTREFTAQPGTKGGWKLAKKAAAHVVKYVQRIEPSVAEPQAKWLADEVKLIVSDGLKQKPKCFAGLVVWSEVVNLEV